MILDDLDVNSSGGIEAEADAFARDALVPPNVWASFDSSKPTTEALVAAAAKAGIHPAILAGRWRWEHGDYKRFSRLLGRGEIKALLST
jgi:HTH-type transcriptional regulator/antitoxin HigA